MFIIFNVKNLNESCVFN